MASDQHPAGRRQPVRIELPVGQLHSYLVGVLGGSGVPVIVLEGPVDELRKLFGVGQEALDRFEAEAGLAKVKR